MHDFHYKGRIDGLHLAFSYAVTTDLVNEAIRRHDCDPVAAHVFGRAITAGLLATSTLNEAERINLRWAYQGLLQTVVVDAGPDGASRGLISPPHLDQAEELDALYGAEGELQLIRSREGKILSSGTVACCFQDVVADLVHYLCISDQVESAMLVLIQLSNHPEHPVALCRGLLIQALPGGDLNRFQQWRERLSSPLVRGLLAREEESDNHLENILHKLIEPEAMPAGLSVVDAGQPRFVCTCSPVKLGAVLRSLPYAERMDIVKKKEPVSITCHFCRKQYALSIEDCIAAWNEKV